MHKVESVKVVAPHTLEVVFDDRVTRRINFLPVLHGDMYGPLREASVFESVRVDEEVKTIVWENGADFDPSLLYRWEEHVEELTKRAKQWENVKA